MNAEVVWVTINAIGITLTVWAERAAHADSKAVRALNGHIVGIVVRGNLLRERIRLAIQLIFLSVGLNAMATPDETPWTPTVVALMVVPCLVVGNTLVEMRDRQRIGRQGRAEIDAERDRRMVRMEARLNVRADERAGIVADKADHIAEVAEDVQAKVNNIAERTT